METHAEIIVRLGGIREVARELGHSNHTTVQGWHDRNNIPMNHWKDLVQLADRLGKPLAAQDFLPAELRDAAA